MTEKMLARVAVSSVPYAADRLYTYLVPDELIGSAEAGKRVTIPFGRGNRRVEGFLLEVGREAATSPLKPIDALLDLSLIHICTVKSRIVPTLTPGSICTDPRSCTHYIVTEYGMVNLKGLSTWQRAEALIGIAHPDLSLIHI